jgi:hypothetical protein
MPRPNSYLPSSGTLVHLQTKYSYSLVESLSPTFEVEHFLNCELESESEASWYGLGLPIHRL